MSPLAPGQWKSLLTASGALYVVITLVRPLRIALAVAMTKVTENVLNEIQARLGCSKAVAFAIQYSLGWVAWMGLASGGIALASACSGVPIWVN